MIIMRDRQGNVTVMETLDERILQPTLGDIRLSGATEDDTGHKPLLRT